MRVVVVGAYGLVGSHVVAALLAAGHAVTAVGRDVAAARRRQPRADWVAADLGTTTRERWAVLLAGADVLVNCAGALQDGARDDLEATHVTGVQRLVEASRDAGVVRVVHVSALGLTPSGWTAFATTKLAGEAALAASGLEAVILRPGLVLAPMAYGGSALLRGLAGFPLVVPLVASDRRIQVVAAQDVAAAVLAAATSPTAPGKTIDLCHADALSLRDIVVTLRAWLGLPAAPVVCLPAFLVGIATGAGDVLSRLGWRSPIRTTTLDQLRHGIEGDGGAAARELGLSLLSLNDLLSRHPSGVQERWFARMYILKPFSLVVLGLFWGFSGLLGLARPGAIAAALRAMDIPPGLDMALALVGALADLALAAALAVRRTARAALVGMLVVSAVYLLGLMILHPALWLDPFGALAKTVPAALLAACALAVMDER